MDINFLELKQQLIQEFQNNDFLTGGALLGLLTTILYSLKVIPRTIWPRIRRKIEFVTLIEEDNTLYVKFENWLKENYKENYRRTKGGLSYYSDKNGNEKQEIVLHQLEDFFIIRKHGAFIRIEKEREKFDGAANMESMFYETIKISSLFGKKAVLKILEEVNQFDIEKSKEKKGVDIFVNNSNIWRKMSEIRGKNIQDVFFNQKEELLDDINNFLNSREWYEKRSIPYKRGYGFFGPPGNGKTTLAISLAAHLKKNLHVANLNNMTDSCFKELFKELNVGTILLLEDIDAMFTKRGPVMANTNHLKDPAIEKSTSSKSSLSLSTMLNCLDGAFYKEGIIVIMTSNHPEKLDPALLRKGRIDNIVNIGNPNKKLAEEYISHFYEQNIKLDGIEGEKELKQSMVDIQGICLNNLTSPQNVKEKILTSNTSQNGTNTKGKECRIADLP